MANDPASHVQLELRPHIHLISSFRCENKGDPFALNPQEIVQLLIRAAAETKGNDESWCWKMLEAPRDRTAFIIWLSPLQLSGRQFPSDGYVWADVEEAGSQQLDGFKLECYRHRSGYVPSYEQYTLHARARYRLLPANSSSTSQSCDPCLWLVLYQRAEKSRTLHIRRIPTSNIQSQKIVLDQRRMILQSGMPKSKDFIWEDRSHWPDIKFPQHQGSQRSLGSNLISRGQQGSYLPGQQLLDPRAGQPSSKRPKQTANASAYVFPNGEDDGGNGDVMDILVPRDISRLRYKQHAEWMEELYASPYSVTSLHPVSLGLGRNGDLSMLGVGIGSIDTPMSIEDIIPAKRISSIDLDRYVRNASDKMQKLKSEMISAKSLHTRRLARVQRGSALRGAEKKLRGTAHFTYSLGPNARDSQTGSSPPGRDTNQKGSDASSRQVDEIESMPQDVQQKILNRVKPLRLAELISKGGLEEKTSAAPISDAQPNLDENMPQAAASTSPPVIRPIDGGSPTGLQAFSSNMENSQEVTHTDDDYVMVDKESQVNEPEPDDSMETNDDQESADAIDGDEFLNFDDETHEDNFDSMFTDAIGSGNGTGTPDDAVIESLHTALGNETSSENPALGGLTDSRALD